MRLLICLLACFEGCRFVFARASGGGAGCQIGDGDLPSVSVALLMTFTSLVLRLVWVALCLPGVAKRPVPSDTTHSRGVPGHRHWHSWMANAVGLLISRPPSCVNERTTKEATRRRRT